MYMAICSSVMVHFVPDHSQTWWP